MHLSNCRLVFGFLILATLMAFPSRAAAQVVDEHIHEATVPEPPAAPPQSGRERAVARAVLAPAAPRIDGVLDEPAWQTAAPIDAFVQQEPTEGQPASDRTEVRILYDRGHLFIGVRAFSSLPVTATEMRRDADRLFDEDNFQIIVDTFRDSRNGYMFLTTPLGAKLEQQIFDEGEGAGRGTTSNINRNWDGVWDAAARIVDDGWTAEVSIPFSTVRFVPSDDQMWGINFERHIRRRNETVQWSLIPKGYGLTRVSMAGDLRGLSGISRGLDLRLKPFFVGGGRNLRTAPTARSTEWIRDIGLDARYGVTAGLNLDLTYNTDFAQVEVDEQQVNLTRFGLFYPEKRDFFLENSNFFTVTNPPATPRFVIAGPTFPDPPFERGVGNTIRPVQWELDNPRLHMWNASVQRTLPADLIATIGYAGSRGTHLFRNSDVNIPVPTPGPDGRPFFAAGLPRPNRAFGTIELKSSDGESWYRALVVELRRNWRNGLSLQSSYTWSHSEDTTQASTFFSDSTNGTTVAFPEIDPDYNRGPSDWDTPHNWVLNAVWDVPVARGASGVRNALLGGWQLTGIGTMRSGQPLTVFVQNNWSRSQWSPSIAPTSGLDRPDLAPGRTPENAVTGRPDQWFDPTAFVLSPQGTMGNSRRGAFRGPNLRTVDVSAVKRIALRGSARMEMRIEVFNLFNRDNFANPTLIAFAGVSPTEAPLPSFGRIRSTVTSARQMQLGVRVAF